MSHEKVIKGSGQRIQLSMLAAKRSAGDASNLVEEEHAIQICLFTLVSSLEVYILSESQEIILQKYTHIFSLEAGVFEILTDLNS